MSTHHITVTINGTPYEGDVEARTLLVHWIRDTLRLTGTHIGRDTTSCGACTILVDGRQGHQLLYHVRGAGRWSPADDRRRAGAGRQAAPVAGGFPRGTRPAMWLLHARHNDDQPGAVAEQSQPDRTRDSRGRLISSAYLYVSGAACSCSVSVK